MIHGKSGDYPELVGVDIHGYLGEGDKELDDDQRMRRNVMKGMTTELAYDENIVDKHD